MGWLGVAWGDCPFGVMERCEVGLEVGGMSKAVVATAGRVIEARRGCSTGRLFRALRGDLAGCSPPRGDG